MTVELDAVRQIPLFAALAPDDLMQIARVTTAQHYTRGEIIILVGERGGGLYYVASGLVKVFKTSEDGKEQVLRLIGPGHTFNDVPALDGGPNPASVMAMEPTVIYGTSGIELRRLIVERPAVAEAAVRTLASAMRKLVALVEDLSFRSVRARVAKILLEQYSPTEQEQSSHPPRRLTQQEIAAMAGTAREMVGRALKELEEAGAIHSEHGQITILSVERLHLLAS